MTIKRPGRIARESIAFAKGAKDVIANPAAAIADVKARDGIINTELETRRLQLAINTAINSPNVPPLHEISIVITWTDAGRQRQFVLNTLRPQRKPPEPGRNP